MPRITETWQRWQSLRQRAERKLRRETLGSAWRPVRSIRIGTAGDTVRGCDMVAVDAQPQLRGQLLFTLIEADSAGIATILMVRDVADLDTPVAAVVSHVVTEDQSLLADIQAFAGVESATYLDPAAPPTQRLRTLAALVSA